MAVVAANEAPIVSQVELSRCVMTGMLRMRWLRGIAKLIKKVSDELVTMLQE